MINNPAAETMLTQEPVPAWRGLLRGKRKALTGLTGAQRVAAHAVLILLCVPALVPLFWMLATSLKTDTQVFATGSSLASLLPHPIKWANYSEAVRDVPFGVYLKNTLLLCVVTVIGSVTSSAIVAYGFAKMEFKGKTVLFLVMISTMALPQQVTMVPVFSLFRWLHWYGTYAPLMVPAFFGAPFYIFLLTQFYRNLPDDLVEAARIDGAGEWRIFLQVMLPLSKPALVTCALFQFLATWNDFFGPLLYINDPAKYTLAYGLQQFVSIHGAEWTRLMAASTLFVLPIIALFFLAQKTFIQGVATTGGKN